MKKRCFLFFLLTSSFCIAQNTPQSDYLLAENYYREGAYKKATQVFKKLYDKNPFNTNYLVRLISCYQESEELLEAEKLLKFRLKKDFAQGYLYVLLGYNYQRLQQTEKATTNYNLALNSLDKKGANANIIGRLFKEYNLLDNAILAYEKVMAKNKKINFNFQIAQIYGEQGNFKKMFEAYIDLVDKNETYFNLVQRYASKYLTDDADNERNVLFRKTLLRKSASKPKDIWNILLSWLFAQQNDYAKAFIQEKALYQRNTKGLEAIFNLGKIAFENKDYEAAQECFFFVNQKSTLKEERIEVSLYVAKIGVATNNLKVATIFDSIFAEFGKNTSTIKIQVEYADFLTFQKNNPEEAKKVLKEAITFSRSKYDKARIKLKLGDVLVFTGKFNKALIYFSQIQTHLKNHELAQEARFKVAQTSYFKGDFEWAKVQLKVLKSATTQLIANDAVALFLTISDNEPVDSIPSGLRQYAKASLYAFQNKNQQAIDTLNLVKKKFKGQPIEDEALFLQARIAIKLKDFENARINFEKVIELNPEGILIDDAVYQLAELYNYQLKNSEKASEYYQKIIFDYPSSIYLVDARKKYRKLRGDNI
jgi:tetratricopeptide (TPR) repeat protein